MATLVRNNTGGAIPLPAAYGFGYVRNDAFVIINDTPANVAVAIGAIPGDGLTLSLTADAQLGSITPLDANSLYATVAALLARTQNATIRGALAEVVLIGEAVTLQLIPPGTAIEGMTLSDVYNYGLRPSTSATEGVLAGDAYTMALLSADAMVEGVSAAEVVWRN